MNICRDIGELSEKAQKACNLFLERCNLAGLNVLITETYRSQERQNYLYEQGRTRAGSKVTWTLNSRHTSRRAWDICKNVGGSEYSDKAFFKACGKIAKDLGIIWGGDWKTPDMPHFEIPKDWSYKGDEPMTTEEKKEFDELRESVEKLSENQEKVYHYFSELPEYAEPTVKKLWERGIYKGKSAEDLDLPETLMRALVINDRAGLYDAMNSEE